MILRLFLFFIVSSLVGGISFAEVQVYPIGKQMRFQENVGQNIEQNNYESYSLHYQSSDYLIGFEYNRFNQQTGNSALRVDALANEYLVAVGYDLYTWNLDFGADKKSDKKFAAASIDFLIRGYWGKTQTTVSTNLYSQTVVQASDSEDDVLGAGGEILFKLGYFILSLDQRALQSKNFTPNWVPVTTVKIGARLDF